MWTLLLGAAVVYAIVGSHGADRVARDQREVRDELRYLAGQVSFALSQDSEVGEAWPAVMRTEGSAPEPFASADLLSAALDREIFLPADPEGRAYLLRRVGPRAWLLGAPKPDGSYFEVDNPAAVQAARDAGRAVDIRLP